MAINAKRVQRVRRQEVLQVRKKQRRMKRLGLSTSERQRASRPNDVWSWDFVEDQTENGTRFRILTLLDEYTRRCLAIHVAWSIRAVDVTEPSTNPQNFSYEVSHQRGQALASRT